MPFALREVIERDLDRLEDMVVLEKVNHSKWASPIIPVVKSDNSICICGDYKVTVNNMLNVDQFLLPNPEELFVTLSGGQKYTKLDMSQAYQQILLDEESRKLATINTHKGLYRPTLLPYGVSPAIAIFQKNIEDILRGIPMVVVWVDDILVSEKSDDDHVRNLDSVLKRLSDAGLKLKRQKCKFMQPSFEYLGYLIDKESIHPMARKVEPYAMHLRPRT